MAVAIIAVVRQSAKRTSAIKGVARMAIQIMLRAAIGLYSHNALLCPPREQMADISIDPTSLSTLIHDERNK